MALRDMSGIAPPQMRKIFTKTATEMKSLRFIEPNAIPGYHLIKKKLPIIAGKFLILYSLKSFHENIAMCTYYRLLCTNGPRNQRGFSPTIVVTLAPLII